MVFHIHIGNITGDLFFLFKLYKCNSKNWNRINNFLDIGSNWVVIIYLTVWNKKDEDKDGDKDEDKDGDKNEDKDGDKNGDKDEDKQKVHCTNTGTQEQFNKNCNNCTYLYLYPLFQ